jgi:hypothetical protein
VGVIWPFGDVCFPVDQDWCLLTGRFREMVEGLALFNPHLTIRLNWFGKQSAWQASDLAWPKWKPCHANSIHWYEPEHLTRLLGAHITYDREAGTDRLVSDVIAEFAGLTGSAKRTRVLEETGLKRTKLSELVVGDQLDTDRIAKLLSAMQAHSRPVTSQRLGIIGEDHFRQRLLALGVTPDSFRYDRKLAKSKNSQSRRNKKASNLPWVLEAAFGWLGPESADQRRIYTGTNWSAAIRNPFRSFGASGEGLETTLADQRATRNEPIVFALHLAHPRIEFTDRAKSALVIEGAA